MNAWRDKMLEGLLGKETAQRLIEEQNELLKYYRMYDGPGQEWATASGLDYIPTKRVTNNIKYLIKEVARFMFSRTPEITIQPVGEEQGNAEKCAALESFIRQVLQKSRFAGALPKAGRDCFIGKRVALKVSGGPQHPLRVGFRPALEVWADYDPEDVNELSTLLYLYQTHDSSREDEQRFWMQLYRAQQGQVTVEERIVDGLGQTVEERISKTRLPIPYIPSVVIINDGLTGDTLGESEVEQLAQLADAYNRMTSDDQDALRFNMYPQTAFTDASQESLANIKVAPKAIIDLQTDPVRMDGQAKAQVLESGFSYNDRLEALLNRLDTDMRKMLGVPPKSLDEYRANGISGKALRALYWPLITKCEEKWAEWDTALTHMVGCLYDLAVAYNQAEGFAGARFTVGIEHLYPITDDEEEERALDLREVQARTRSRRSYIDKWRPNDNADEEIQQIISEQRQLEEQFGPVF